MDSSEQPLVAFLSNPSCHPLATFTLLVKSQEDLTVAAVPGFGQSSFAVEAQAVEVKPLILALFDHQLATSNHRIIFENFSVHARCSGERRRGSISSLHCRSHTSPWFRN